MGFFATMPGKGVHFPLGLGRGTNRLSRPDKKSEPPSIYAASQEPRMLKRQTPLPSKDDVHVRFAGVSKTFDGTSKIVDDLDLDIYRTEFLTLLGPSGSGKTTCLMMLAGFEPMSGGSIFINGEEVYNKPPHKRNIGMVFQNYALFPNMTVGKNLAFPLEVRGVGATERGQRVARALDLVQLEGFEDRRPSQLSGGQQQRIAIARALVFEPDLVLMDEPLGALDRTLREEMQYEIRRIQRNVGVTMVYVTHDQQEAMVLSDRVAVFNEGRIQQVSDPETLYEQPDAPFVSEFIGENNHLPGLVSEVSDRVVSVIVGNARVKAFGVGEFRVGDASTVAIRPERVALSPEPGLYSNEFEAVVNDIVFLGDHLRISVRVIGQDDFVVKISNILGHGLVLPGDRVTIGWSALDCRALALE